MTTEYARRRYVAHAESAAARLDREAPGNMHANGNPRRSRFGLKQADEAFAIRWLIEENAALRLQIDPMIEGPRQILAEMAAE